jgi:polyphenol oxidase
MELLRAPGLLGLGGIVHGFTTRKGGGSRGALGTLNLGTTVGDERPVVSDNRQLVLKALGKTDAAFVSLRQVHGDSIVEVTRLASKSIEADALWTRDASAVVAVLTADCVPILMAHESKKAVAAVHAGWRGTKAKVSGLMVNRLKDAGLAIAGLHVAIGPGIGPCCFEIGADVAAELRAAFGEGTPHVRTDERGKLVADLWALNHEALIAAGVPAGNIEQLRRCTFCETDLFFSHRRDQGKTGRQAGVIGLAG